MQRVQYSTFMSIAMTKEAKLEADVFAGRDRRKALTGSTRRGRFGRRMLGNEFPDRGLPSDERFGGIAIPTKRHHEDSNEMRSMTECQFDGIRDALFADR